jgi:hypothetical protein
MITPLAKFIDWYFLQVVWMLPSFRKCASSVGVGWALAHAGSFFGRDGVTEDELGRRKVKMSRIMWIEGKDGLAGRARIGRVTFSKTRQ